MSAYLSVADHNVLNSQKIEETHTPKEKEERKTTKEEMLWILKQNLVFIAEQNNEVLNFFAGCIQQTTKNWTDFTLQYMWHREGPPPKKNKIQNQWYSYLLSST